MMDSSIALLFAGNLYSSTFKKFLIQIKYKCYEKTVCDTVFKPQIILCHAGLSCELQDVQ